jgi:hypothetical protein
VCRRETTKVSVTVAMKFSRARLRILRERAARRAGEQAGAER